MGKEEFIKSNLANNSFQRRPSMQGQNNPRWNGGISEYPDHYLLKKNRIEKLKSVQGKCEICGNQAKLVHHIDENKSNHSISNLLVVCSNCHGTIHHSETGCKTSKYIRIYGMTIKDLEKITGLYNTIIIAWTKNSEYRSLLQQAIRDGQDNETIRKNINELWTKIKDQESQR